MPVAAATALAVHVKNLAAMGRGTSANGGRLAPRSSNSSGGGDLSGRGDARGGASEKGSPKVTWIWISPERGGEERVKPRGSAENCGIAELRRIFY